MLWSKHPKNPNCSTIPRLKRYSHEVHINMSLSTDFEIIFNYVLILLWQFAVSLLLPMHGILPVWDLDLLQVPVLSHVVEQAPHEPQLSHVPSPEMKIVDDIYVSNQRCCNMDLTLTACRLCIAANAWHVASMRSGPAPNSSAVTCCGTGTPWTPNVPCSLNCKFKIDFVMFFWF